MLSHCTYEYNDETVCRWRVEAFKKLYLRSTSGDRWASDVFCIAEPFHTYIRFYLEFYPHGHVGSESRASSLYVKLIDMDRCSFYEYEARAWIESNGLMYSDVYSAIVQPGSIRTVCGWKTFIPLCQFYTMIEHSPDLGAYICFGFPRIARLDMYGFPCSTINLRWKIDQFAEHFDNAKVGDLWKSEKLTISDFQHTDFCFLFYPKGETERDSSWCSIYFHVDGETNERNVGLKYEIWIENERGERKHTTAEAYVYLRAAPWRQARYIKCKALRKFASYGPLFVSCNFCRLLRTKPRLPLK
ncbi:hypothetical protein M3Y94_00623500 [Aphelenchoides besseyi]|nr:hypothetical protein M3Y94_00623500 [Aphelenchoides besseyi]KAI6218949.1 hypothetical protein M3Y95_01142500 [Aphelenchoides besseyi]